MSEKKIIPNDILLGEATDLLARGIEVVLMTKGNSMLPFIRGERDSVRLKKMDTLNVGDIVLSHIRDSRGARYVLHRIIAIDGDSVTLMGDGNLIGTESCQASDISGTVLEIIRPSGKGRKVTKAVIWRKLLPVRRYLLAIIRRII